jgi:hypothetical protein
MCCFRIYYGRPLMIQGYIRASEAASLLSGSHTNNFFINWINSTSGLSLRIISIDFELGFRSLPLLLALILGNVPSKNLPDLAPFEMRLGGGTPSTSMNMSICSG